MIRRIAKLILREIDFNLLKSHAEKIYPLEAPAILVGEIMTNIASVDEVILTKNNDESPISFTIDSTELLEIYKKANRENKEVIGIFHSHPAPPKPSRLDMKFMSSNPFVWIIMSMPGGDFEAYQLWNNILHKVNIIFN